jgi:hypothetical protein
MHLVPVIAEKGSKRPSDEQYGLESFCRIGGWFSIPHRRISFPLQGMFDGFANEARNPIFWGTHERELRHTTLARPERFHGGKNAC